MRAPPHGREVVDGHVGMLQGTLGGWPLRGLCSAPTRLAACSVQQCNGLNWRSVRGGSGERSEGSPKTRCHACSIAWQRVGGQPLGLPSSSRLACVQCSAFARRCFGAGKRASPLAPLSLLPFRTSRQELARTYASMTRRSSRVRSLAVACLRRKLAQQGVKTHAGAGRPRRSKRCRSDAGSS
jgi:hypothetical protein